MGKSTYWISLSVAQNRSVARSLIWLALFAGQAQAEPRNLSIFVLAGQSNMSGRGELPSSPLHFAGIWNYTNAGRWEPATDPLDGSAGQVDVVSADLEAGLGPGLTFAKKMQELRPRIKIGLVQCSRGATTIDAWNIQGGRDTLYGSCIARIHEAARNGRIVGLLWWQGESDAYSKKAAQAWGGHFRKLIAAFRHDLESPHLPVVYVQLGQLSPERRAQPSFAFWDSVMQSQARVRISSSIMILANKFELSNDGIHLSPKGYTDIGRQFARSMHLLIAPR